MREAEREGGPWESLNVKLFTTTWHFLNKHHVLTVLYITSNINVAVVLYRTDTRVQARSGHSPSRCGRYSATPKRNHTGTWVTNTWYRVQNTCTMVVNLRYMSIYWICITYSKAIYIHTHIIMYKLQISQTVFPSTFILIWWGLLNSMGLWSDQTTDNSTYY